jgi:cytochrome P450
MSDLATGTRPASAAQAVLGTKAMPGGAGKIPHGPCEPYDPSQELVDWMELQRRQFGDIYRACVYGSDIYVVSDPQYVHHILRKNWQNYRKGLAIKRVELLLGRGLISSEGDFWKSQRRRIQPAFHHTVIAGLTKVITDANATLLEKWERAARNRESVNVTHDISLMVLEMVLVSIFGEDYPQVAPHFSILAEESARDLQFAQTFKPLRKVVARVAAQRRAEGRIGMDFLGMFMEARDRDSGEVMSDAQLVTEIITLIVAGHETTALTLNWTWYLLAKNPDAEEKFVAELEILCGDHLPELAELQKFTYTRQILDEALRLYPPVWLITRKAQHDDRLGDYVVPAGTEIYFSPYLIQRHPDLWKAPERFDPGRFDPDRSRDRHPLAMHPFSAGPRNCIGEALARLEMQIHLLMIGKRLRLRRADETPLELEFGVNLRNRHDFIMTPEIRAWAGH